MSRRRKNGHLCKGGRGENHSQGSFECMSPLSSLGVLLDVTLEMNLCTLGKEALTSFLTTTTKGVTASFSTHARTETVLTFTGALGWLVGAFHDENGGCLIRAGISLMRNVRKYALDGRAN